MTERICPDWFLPVACIIIYRQSVSRTEFLLGRRKPNEAEGGKWGLIGGTGAFFERSEGPLEFAVREMIYNLNITVDPERLQHFTTLAKYKPSSLITEIYFSYQVELDKELEVTGNEKAPDECQWFLIKEIEEMAQNGQIAFGNEVIIKQFDLQQYPGN